MKAGRYVGAGSRWAAGATLVYAPIAAELVAMSPHPLVGRTVLDAGAGTGAVSFVLAVRRARPVATDLWIDMLAWNARARPPCVVADICALPIPAGRVAAAVAAFVLNHLTEPSAGLAELARVIRPGGAVLAAVFSNASRSQARDRVDAVAQDAGWQVPDWYTGLKTTAVPILGTAEAMRAAADVAGLACVLVQERPVDVSGIEPEQLVSYRLGRPCSPADSTASAPAGQGKSHPMPPTRSGPSCSRTGRSWCSWPPACRPDRKPNLRCHSPHVRRGRRAHTRSGAQRRQRRDEICWLRGQSVASCAADSACTWAPRSKHPTGPSRSRSLNGGGTAPPGGPAHWLDQDRAADAAQMNSGRSLAFADLCLSGRPASGRPVYRAP